MATCVLSNQINSFFNGFIVLLIFLPEGMYAIPQMTSSTVGPDPCMELPLKCADDLGELGEQPSCEELQIAYGCLERVIDLCNDHDSGVDGYLDHTRQDNLGDLDDVPLYDEYPAGAMDFGLLVQNINATFAEIQMECQPTETIDGSTPENHTPVENKTSTALFLLCFLFSRFYLSCISYHIFL